MHSLTFCNVIHLQHWQKPVWNGSRKWKYLPLTGGDLKTKTRRTKKSQLCSGTFSPKYWFPVGDRFKGLLSIMCELSPCCVLVSIPRLALDFWARVPSSGCLSHSCAGRSCSVCSRELPGTCITHVFMAEFRWNVRFWKLRQLGEVDPNYCRSRKMPCTCVYRKSLNILAMVFPCWTYQVCRDKEEVRELSFYLLWVVKKNNRMRGKKKSLQYLYLADSIHDLIIYFWSYNICL